jgi:hypothetical protein
LVGLHPSAVDYSRQPGLDEATLTARIEAREAVPRAAGFAMMSSMLSASTYDRRREHARDLHLTS